MYLELSDEQSFFHETVRRFLQTEMPMSKVRELSDSDDGVDRAWWREAANLGWCSLLVPAELGGGSLSGRPLQDASIVAEEIGRMVSPGPFVPVNVVVNALSRHPGPHDGVITELVNGNAIATWAFAESASRWSAPELSATAVIDGDSVIVTGHKTYVESATIADHFLVTARGDGGLTQVLVPRDASGMTIAANGAADLVRRFGNVRLDAVRLPRSAIVGEPGGADADVELQLQMSIALHCAETVGVIDRVFEFTVEYAQDRYAFGRPIASYQALKHRIADQLLALESCKSTTEAAIDAIDEESSDADRLISVAKSYVGTKSLPLISEAVQLHGGIGLTWEHDLHVYGRRVALNRAMYGTPEHHRERICQLLGV